MEIDVASEFNRLSLFQCSDFTKRVAYDLDSKARRKQLLKDVPRGC